MTDYLAHALRDYNDALTDEYRADRRRFGEDVLMDNFTPMTPLELQHAEAHCKACQKAYRYRELLDRRWQVKCLRATITQQRAELAAVDKSLGVFYCPVLDPETGEECGSFYEDHGIHIVVEELRKAQARLVVLGK